MLFIAVRQPDGSIDIQSKQEHFSLVEMGPNGHGYVTHEVTPKYDVKKERKGRYLPSALAFCAEWFESNTDKIEIFEREYNICRDIISFKTIVQLGRNTDYFYCKACEYHFDNKDRPTTEHERELNQRYLDNFRILKQNIENYTKRKKFGVLESKSKKPLFFEIDPQGKILDIISKVVRLCNKEYSSESEKDCIIKQLKQQSRVKSR